MHFYSQESCSTLRKMNLIDELRKEELPQISIGMPIYNGEQFLHQRLESILSQTFTDFELIISDNASTDSTGKICEEYARKDHRIRYIRQEKNIGALLNFNFVLKEVKFNYFVWMASDDIIERDFLEKNIKILLSKKNVVCSTSKIKFTGSLIEELESNSNDSIFKKIEKKIKSHFSSANFYSMYGVYEKKVRSCMKASGHTLVLYGVYRIDILRKSITDELFLGRESVIILNALRYGDFHVIDEVLMHKLVDRNASSAGGMIKLMRIYKQGHIGKVFVLYPFTAWFVKHLGWKLFLQNLDSFIILNFNDTVYYLVDIIRLFRYRK